MRDEGASPNPENLYQEWWTLIHDYVSQNYPDVSAEDITQDTIEFILRLRRKSRRWQPSAEFLKRAACRLARTDRQARQADRDSLHLAYVPDDLAGADELVLADAERRQLLRAWKMLEASDREVLEALICNDVTPQQEAKKLGISYDAVRKRKQRARDDLRQYFTCFGLLAATWFAIKDIVRRVSESQASAYLANAATLATAGAVGAISISMLPPSSPDRGQESSSRDVRPVVTSISEPADGVRHPRPPARPLPRPVVGSPAALTTSPLHGDPVLVPDGSPAHPELYANLDTDEGPKERHDISVETPLGPVMIRGHRHATTPAKAAAVRDHGEQSLTGTPQPVTTDGTR